MTQITLTLLGSFEVTVDGQAVTGFATDKVRALLAYLALERARAHRRETLAGLLWPDIADQSSLTNLRKTLHRLREALTKASPTGHPSTGDALFTITRQTIQLNPTHCVVDVAEFEALLVASTTHDHPALAACDGCLARLTQAVTLYRGELLAGFGLRDAPAFEEWLLLRRESLHHHALLALNQLSLAHEARDELELAHRYATRQLALDPYREETHRQVMRLLAQRGMVHQALAQYESCRRLLRDEVGVEPTSETVAVAEQIRAGSFDKMTRWPRGGNPLGAGDKVTKSSAHPVTPSPTHDLSEMPAVDQFHGRAAELAELEQWLVDEARLVAVLGMGGVGKTTLAAQAVKGVAAGYAFVLWRSLLNAPPLTEVLSSWLQILSQQTLTTLPDSPDEQLRLLLTYLRQERCLLVLDNMESILLGEERAGQPRPGYEGYLHLLQRVGTTEHQSCLLLTSRERPRGTARLAQTTQSVRVLPLAGLDLEAGQALLAGHGLAGAQAHTRALVEHYSGHPLALQIVAATIAEVFNGDVAAFQRDGAVVFDDIGAVLDEQFARLSDLEQQILFWLTIEREAVPVGTLRENLVQQPSQRTLLEAFRALQRRSLLVQQGEGFTLQNVVIEYLTERLVEGVCAELLNADKENLTHNVSLSPRRPLGLLVSLSFLNRYTLLKAQVKEYVRQSQARLILQPIAERLLAKLGKARLMAQIQAILTGLRTEAPLAAGYAGGNLLNLLLQLRVDLSGYDFSRLSVWQADLRGVTVADLNFGEADLSHSAFTLNFNIFAIMFDQSGQVLIAAPAHGDICLWRVAKGQLHDAFRTPSKGGFPLSFSHNGQLLAGGCLDHTIRLWSVETGATLHILQGHTELANAVAFSPDTQQLASSSRDNTIRLWDVRSGRCLWILNHESKGHIPLAYRPAQQAAPLLASGGREQTICLWDTKQGRVIDLLRGHLREIESLAFSPDGALLASGGHDGTILLWDVRVPEQSQLLGAFQGHSQVVHTLMFHPNSQLLASGSSDCTIRLWDVNSRQTRQLLLGHASEVSHFAFNPDGSALASGSADRVVRLWDTQTGHALDVLSGYIDTIHAVRFSPDGRQLASGSADGLIRLWGRSNQRNYDRPTRALQGHAGQVLTVAFSPAPSGQSSLGASLLASGSTDTTVQLWDVATGKTVHTLRGHTGPVKSLAFRHDGRLLVSGSADRTIRFWSVTGSSGVAAEQSGRVLRGHTDDVATVAFSPDGRLLVSSSFDHTARLWAVESGQEIYVLQGHTAALCAATFSPNGARVATISYDNTVCLWEVATGRSSAGWDGISAGGRIVAFSPRGDLLIYGIEEVSLMIRDVRTGGVLHTLRGHSSTIIALDFSPTEPILASSSWDGTIRLWDLQTGACLQTLRAPGPYAGMNITGVTGISEAQKAALKALGAVEG